MTADLFRELDAAYVLGALSSDERRVFERHLTGCPDCTEAVGELAGLPGLLAAVPRSVAEAEPIEAPPTTLLPSLVRRVRSENRRRRWTVGLVAASTATAIGIGGLALESQRVEPSARPVTTPTASPTASRADTAMTALAASPVSASVALTGVAWGTRLELTCTYAGKDDYDTSSAAYVLVVRGRDGRTEQVASWRALPGRTMRLTGASAYSVDGIESIELRTDRGTALLELRS
jgi:anti-sigma factor RsiW